VPKSYLRFTYFVIMAVSTYRTPSMWGFGDILGFSVYLNSPSNSFSPCSSTTFRPLSTDSLTVEDAMFIFFDIQTALIPSSRVLQKHSTLLALTAFRCFPPISNSLNDIPNRTVTLSINQNCIPELE